MSIKKRLLSAALALTLGASLLTGCSKGADGSGSQSSSGDSSSDVQAMDLTDVTDPYLATAGVAGDTVVGNDVWIGTEAMIMPGVRIGDGAVIAARAVVTADVEPYAVVAGMPARQLRRRFSQERIAMLLEMRWWDWPLERINAAMPLLCSGQVERLHEFWRSGRDAVQG